MFNAILDSLLAIAYPQTCQICENSVENLADGVVCDAGGLGVVVAAAVVPVGRSEDLRVESDL